jgi:[acyl-carrier-protein] S-malonyltransferase
VANVLAKPITDPADIRRHLVEQVTGTVRWRESVGFMAANGVSRLVEVGAGKVLSGLAKRIVKELAASNVGTPDDVAAFKATLEPSA